MGLKQYKAKRDLSQSKEPAGGKKLRGKRPLFVVQKHRARNLHYDFRLECKGVLWSWAVPKPLPRRKKLKRLAVEVEDHPIGYADFEGIIPKGHYGAGKVEIWDRGTYLARGAKSKKESEKMLRAQKRKGHIALTLFGKKLKNNYDLILFRREKRKLWLIMKT